MDINIGDNGQLSTTATCQRSQHVHKELCICLGLRPNRFNYLFINYYGFQCLVKFSKFVEITFTMPNSDNVYLKCLYGTPYGKLIRVDIVYKLPSAGSGIVSNNVNTVEIAEFPFKNGIHYRKWVFTEKVFFSKITLINLQMSKGDILRQM